MALNKAGKLRKYHQIIEQFSIKKGTFDHKSTNQPKPPEEASKDVSFFVKPSIYKGLRAFATL